MRDVTGAPAYEYFIDNVPGIFEQVLDADKKDYIMTAGCCPDNEAELQYIRSKGLIAEHSYGVIKAARVKDKNGKMVDLVQLRNPWATFEWTGRWGDNSDCWTQKLKD